MNGKKIETLLRQSTADEQTIEKLIRLGGQRDDIDPACTERVRQGVYQTWLLKQQQDQRSQENNHHRLESFFRWINQHRLNRRAWFMSAGLVAGVLLVGVMIPHLLRFLHSQGELQGQGEIVARVAAVQGEVTMGSLALATGAAVRMGEDVHTGSTGSLALTLANGALVKIDRLTKVRFSGGQDMQLMAGAIYFDSLDTGKIRIHTPRGTATDIGTQFETRFSQDELLVRVRDGKVRVDQAQTAVYVASGQALQLADGAARITEIPAGDEQWIWADSLDDNFSLTNRSMAEILVWLSRKEGWVLEYQREADQQRARQDIIRGRLSTADSEEMLRQLSLISDMRFQMNDKTLVVSYPQ